MSKSVITDYTDISVFSGRPKECDHHAIYGNGLHKLADEDLLTIPLTNAEHNLSPKGTINQIHGNPAAEKLSKISGQLAWERKELIMMMLDEESGEPLPEQYQRISEEVRERFRKRYGKSYL